MTTSSVNVARLPAEARIDALRPLVNQRVRVVMRQPGYERAGRLISIAWVDSGTTRSVLVIRPDELGGDVAYPLAIVRQVYPI